MDVMSDKDEECKGCADEGQTYGAWPCDTCSRNLDSNSQDRFRAAKDSPVSAELNKAFKNV